MISFPFQTISQCSYFILFIWIKQEFIPNPNQLIFVTKPNHS